MGRQLGIDAAATGPRAGTGKPVEGCWFCLSNANADIDLVVSVGELPHVLFQESVESRTGHLEFL